MVNNYIIAYVEITVELFTTCSIFTHDRFSFKTRYKNLLTLYLQVEIVENCPQKLEVLQVHERESKAMVIISIYYCTEKVQQVREAQLRVTC